MELVGSRQSPAPWLVAAHPEPEPLPSAGITRVPRYYGLLRLLAVPGPDRPVAPCCGTPNQVSRVARQCVCACCAHYPGGRIVVAGRVLGRSWQPSPIKRRLGARIMPFRGLLRLHSRCGPHTCRPTFRGPVLGAPTGRSPFPPSKLLPGCPDDFPGRTSTGDTIVPFRGTHLFRR